MSLRAALAVAWRGLLANKMRSLLTMLGIIIGVAAVIVMISIGQGATAQVTERIARMGSNLLLVRPGTGFGAVRGAAGTVNTLTLDDATAIASLPLVQNVAPEINQQVTAAAGSQTWTTTVKGTSASYPEIRNLPVAAGSFFTAEDVAQAALVAVLGPTVEANLFPNGTSAVGQTITLNNLRFTVIGVLAPQGSGMGGADQDDMVYIPITTAQRRFTGRQNVQVINVQARDAESLNTVQDEVAALLRQRHHLSPQQADDFTIQNMTAIMETVADTTKTMTLLLASVAAVSLLVGGIGIMNIMLVSVTERTREIGIRMAVGATGGAILTQFLIEALVLSLAGGVIGMLAGLTGSRLVSILAGWPAVIAPASILLAIGFSALVGIFFGYYPARKAATANPIEALRYE
ncbi:Permease FtsX-like [Moorella glycerini]|uniref:Macrolide export ATP-binding/permease protein MacB n=1 Tax=Neomoorella stamsii TaxID=1266720 RepID=A0A9X7J537_9FIRM|nr:MULTISPECIES: ABC transporter permease [Moorella]PRR76741.1 Macrolide export ATP-binding/permease protein MacB [Moorella stamsii]CEP66725.1 Permease FtsX-like [Moorella glycerini]